MRKSVKGPALVGKTFGRLTVIAEDFARIVPGRHYVLVHCECKQIKSTRSDGLISGHTVSCGCKKKEHGLRHGHRGIGSRDPTYQSWDGMVQRCTNPKNPKYSDYGGRGITIPRRWAKFENFLADMGERPQGLSLERKNNAKPYSKANCIWDTHSAQMLNTRRTVKVLYKGKLQPLIALTRKAQIPDQTARYRLRAGWSIQQILSTS